MSKYFEARNENDVVQIDDDFINIGLNYTEYIDEYYAATIKFATMKTDFEDASGQGLTMYLYLIPVDSNTTIFVEAPPDTKIALVQNITPAEIFVEGSFGGYASGNYAVIGIGGGIGYSSNGQWIDIVPYVSRSKAGFVKIHRYVNWCKVGGDYGLQCFNADGEIVFNSNQQQLRVVDVWYEQNKKSDDLHGMAVSYTGESVFTKRKTEYGKPIIVSPIVNCYCDSTRDVNSDYWLAYLKCPIYILDTSSVEIGYVTYVDFYPTTTSSGYEETMYPKMNLIQMAFAPRLSNYTHFLVAEK